MPVRPSINQVPPLAVVPATNGLELVLSVHRVLYKTRVGMNEYGGECGGGVGAVVTERR
jgi:hypothetical protein